MLTCVAATANAGDKQQVLWNQVQNAVTETERLLDGVLGVAVVDLTGNQELFVRADEVFPTASSIKVAVLTELYKQAQRASLTTPGSTRLTDTYTVRAEDLVADSDIMAGLSPGITRLTLKDLATMMVAVSDNAATNVLIDQLGMTHVNATLNELGLRQTRLQRKMMDLKAAAEGRENVSTPRELAMLLTKLYRGEVLKEPWRSQFFEVLATHKEGYLTKRLPEGLKIANKPGALEGVRNDVAVVFLKSRPYVICVMTTYLNDERAAEEAIGTLSAAVFSVFDRLSRASDYGRIISPANSGTR